eukprot:1046860-Prorocentrum_minimum.AAC.1
MPLRLTPYRPSLTPYRPRSSPYRSRSPPYRPRLNPHRLRAGHHEQKKNGSGGGPRHRLRLLCGGGYRSRDGGAGRDRAHPPQVSQFQITRVYRGGLERV